MLREDYGVEGIVVGHAPDADALEHAEARRTLAGVRRAEVGREGERGVADDDVSEPGSAEGKRTSFAPKTSASGGVIHPKHRASALICTRGTPASLGCVIRDAAEARVLVEARGGADATDGDAAETALDFVAAESAAFGPQRVARINAEAEGGGGCGWGGGENVRVVGCAVPRRSRT